MTTTSPRLNDFVPLVCHCFFNDTATTEIYTLSLHDALPIWGPPGGPVGRVALAGRPLRPHSGRSEEHTSELQSHLNLVCRLLLEKNRKFRRSTRSHRSAALARRAGASLHGAPASPPWPAAALISSTCAPVSPLSCFYFLINRPPTESSFFPLLATFRV